MADTPQDRLARFNPMPPPQAARLAQYNSCYHHPGWRRSDVYTAPASKTRPKQAGTRETSISSFERKD